MFIDVYPDDQSSSMLVTEIGLTQMSVLSLKE